MTEDEMVPEAVHRFDVIDSNNQPAELIQKAAGIGRPAPWSPPDNLLPFDTAGITSGQVPVTTPRTPGSSASNADHSARDSAGASPAVREEK